MTKIIKINNCIECPHSQILTCMNQNKIQILYVCKAKGKIKKLISKKLDIPHWCPLEGSK